MTTKPKLSGVPAAPLTPSQAAARHGVSRARFNVLLNTKRVIGAQQLDNGYWIIPADFTVTPDPRIKPK